MGGGGNSRDEGSSVKTGLYLVRGGGVGGFVAQSNMTRLQIASNVIFFLCCIYFYFFLIFCHMPTFNSHLVLFLFFLS